MMQMKTAVFFPLYDSFTDGTNFISYYSQTWNICTVQQIFEVIMSSHVVNSIIREMVVRADKQGMAGTRSAVGNVNISGINKAVTAEKAKQC